jgi:Isocitrate lyase family
MGHTSDPGRLLPLQSRFARCHETGHRVRALCRPPLARDGRPKCGEGIWLCARDPTGCARKETGLQSEPQLQLDGPWLFRRDAQKLCVGSGRGRVSTIHDFGISGERSNCVKSRFVLQLISLAGLHSGATITHELSQAFKKDGMLAYVNLVQRREKESGCDVLTHQKWSGAQLVDGMVGVIQSGNSSSKSMGEGNTEDSEMSPSTPLGEQRY